MDPVISIAHLLNGLLMIAMPIGLGIYLTRKFKYGWRLWWIGAATFVISQLGHIPFNRLVEPLIRANILPSLPQEWKLPATAIWLGLSAGLWEETIRYAAYRWWAKDARTWSKGVLLGAGHGGIEAIILGILVLYSYVQLVAIYNLDLSTIVSPDRLGITQQAVKIYWSSPWYTDILGAVERAFAIPTQIALSVLVLQVFTRQHIRWLFIAILWHAAVDAIAYYASITWGAYIAEGILAFVALIDIVILIVFYQPDPAPTPNPASEPLPLPPLSLPPKMQSETPEDLEQTRYNYKI
jgi:uncharacterized membrane protein YhfC